MADQLNATGSMTTGLPLALLAASAPKPATEKPRLAKTADSQPQKPGTQAASEPNHSSDAAMDEVNNHLQQSGSELKFQMDSGTGRTVFKVVNPNSGEVLLQVPSEEMLALARNLRSLDSPAGASGVLMDKEG